MNKLIIAVLACGCAAYVPGALNAQETSTKTVKTKSEHGRIEQVREGGNKIMRFFDRDGKKTNEIQLGETTVRARLKKNTRYSATDFGLKLSSGVARALDSAAKGSRDVVIQRRISKEARKNDKGNFWAVSDLRSDFLDYADVQSEDEYTESPVETERISTVYDLDGNEIVKIPGKEGWHPIVSNTGRYFIVTVGEHKGLRILNRNKAVLAEVPFVGSAYFSESDRYILLIEDLLPGGKAAVNVFDTKENKLELRKVVVNRLTFQTIKQMEILEPSREIIVKHIWNPQAQESKVEKVKF